MPGFPSFTRNKPSPAPSRPGPFQRIPSPGSENAQEASAVYSGFYGTMPMPATQFATSVTALKSTDIEPQVLTSFANASIVDRRNRRNGIVYTAGRQLHGNWTPEYNRPVFSSEFQKKLIGPHVNYILNRCWYSAGYPAASVMLGGMRNLGLSQRIPQLPTKTSGGPGPSAMRPSPRFSSVQQVPRYSTMPNFYNTQSQPG